MPLTNNPNNEEELINSCKKDGSYYKNLYNRYSEKIYNFAIWLTGDNHTAEELTQDAFVKFYFSLNKFNPKKGRIISYIFKIVQNSYKNLKRKEFFVRKQNPPPASEDAEKFILLKETEKEIMDNINQLPMKDRTAFILNKIEHLTIDEVSEIMSVSKQEVSNKINRAKNRLQKKLKNMY